MAESEKTAKVTESKTATAAAEKKKMPKGGRKGGTIFPRVALKQALSYSKKLVSKTAVAAQSEATILAGVFGNSGPKGRVRASALKQFGLMEGTPAAYKATQLARDIDAAADEAERLVLIRKAMLSSKVFRQLFETYHGDEASKGKIRSRTQQLEVHPDFGDECAELFITSAETAALAVRDGDSIRLIAATDAALPGAPEEETPEGSETEVDESIERHNQAGSIDHTNRAEELTTPLGTKGAESTPPTPRPRTAADVTVNLNVDSSLDGDKLGKQLELLRRFGLI